MSARLWRVDLHGHCYVMADGANAAAVLVLSEVRDAAAIGLDVSIDPRPVTEVEPEWRDALPLGDDDDGDRSCAQILESTR